MSTQIAQMKQTREGLYLKFVASDLTCNYPWWWLQDHGEDSVNRDPDSLQRTKDTFAIEDHPQPDAVAVHESRTKLGIRWPDGPPTLHTAEELARVAQQACRLYAKSETRLRRPPANGVSLWSTSAPPESQTAFAWADVIRAGATTERLYRHLRTWGFAVIEPMPSGKGPVKELAQHLGYVRETIFGGVWELSTNVSDHQDSAYDTTFLGPHTDGTYSHDGPGLQVFSCQERTGAGGESILVDGYAAAARLFDSHPEYVDVLSRAPVKSRYIEPGVHLEADRPTLRFDAQGQLSQISLNNYDRAPFLLRPRPEAVAFRDAYAALHHIVNDESSWLKLSWKPGQAVVLDNWRILHGRSSFSGRRRFVGCYTNHEDFESKLRQLSPSAKT